MTKSLSMRVASPCSERWEDMLPRGEGRHCASCEKTVVDLTRVTRRQAEQLVREKGGALCVRLAEDERGELVFRSERKRLPVFAPVALASLLAACAAEPNETGPIEDETEHPVDLPEGDATHLDASPASFGGSLATGMMMPVAPTHACAISSAELLPPPPGSDGNPTADQLALTRRKHRRTAGQQQSSVPVVHHTMGVMALSRDL